MTKLLQLSSLFIALFTSSLACGNSDKPYLSAHVDTIMAFVPSDGTSPLGASASVYLGDSFALEGSYIKSTKYSIASGRVRVFPMSGSFNFAFSGEQLTYDMSNDSHVKVEPGRGKLDPLVQHHVSASVGNRWTPGIAVIGIDWISLGSRIAADPKDAYKDSPRDSRYIASFLRLSLGIGI